MKDRLYTISDGGFIFTSAWVVTPAPVLRRSAVIALTARGAPFEISLGNRTTQHQAVAMKPMTQRTMRAENVRLISIQLHPTHPAFTRFRAIPAPGVMALPREKFRHLDEAFDAAYGGLLTHDQVTQLFRDAIAVTLPLLPEMKPPDPRIEAVIQLLRDNYNFPLKSLAKEVGLSYDRLSHLFVEAMGIPLRSYQLWRKVHKASLLFQSGQKLTEIAHQAGFTDSAHLCRAFQQTHGAPPSYFLDANSVAIYRPAERNQPAELTRPTPPKREDPHK